MGGWVGGTYVESKEVVGDEERGFDEGGGG